MRDQQFEITIDDKKITAKPGQTIMEAADAAGIYIPRLCYHDDLIPGGHCRLCTVKVNSKPVNSCSFPAAKDQVIENETEELQLARRRLIEMLFVEGNHFCPFCEKSGNCELQAMAYRLGMTAPSYPYLFRNTEVDASHKDVFIDRNRCILCGRCVRASRDLDKKVVFGFENRGIHKKVAIDSPVGLNETSMDSADQAAGICPTGSIVVKRVGYSMPYGTRKFDKEPIGSDIEKKG